MPPKSIVNNIKEQGKYARFPVKEYATKYERATNVETVSAHAMNLHQPRELQYLRTEKGK